MTSKTRKSSIALLALALALAPALGAFTSCGSGSNVIELEVSGMT